MPCDLGFPGAGRQVSAGSITRLRASFVRRAAIACFVTRGSRSGASGAAARDERAPLMRLIKTTATAAAVMTVGFVLAAPAAHAATAPRADNSCRAAIHAAQEAKHDFDAAAEDLKEQVA